MSQHARPRTCLRAANVSPPHYADRKEFDISERKKALWIRNLLRDRGDARVRERGNAFAMVPSNGDEDEISIGHSRRTDWFGRWLQFVLTIRTVWWHWRHGHSRVDRQSSIQFDEHGVRAESDIDRRRRHDHVDQQRCGGTHVHRRRWIVELGNDRARGKLQQNVSEHRNVCVSLHDPSGHGGNGHRSLIDR